MNWNEMDAIGKAEEILAALMAALAAGAIMVLVIVYGYLLEPMLWAMRGK